jgi:hypothetical protein
MRRSRLWVRHDGALISFESPVHQVVSGIVATRSNRQIVPTTHPGWSHLTSSC